MPPGEAQGCPAVPWAGHFWGCFLQFVLKARAGQDGDRIEALDNVALVSCGFGKLDLTV